VTWEVNDREFETVLGQSADRQYKYFVGHCADWQEVWGLAVEGGDWAMTEDPDTGTQRFAVWPHPRYAEACRQRAWAHREPAAIEVHAFVDDLLTRLIADGTDVAVFPLPDGRFTPVGARRLRSDLDAELGRME
jgi:hypothetical protein